VRGEGPAYHPLPQLSQARGWWSDGEEGEWLKQVRREVLDAFGKAERVKKSPPEEMFNGVYAELTPQLERQREEMKRHLEEYG